MFPFPKPDEMVGFLTGEMTGQWEYALAKIGSGEMDAATFHRSIEVYASQITTKLLDIPFERTDDRPRLWLPEVQKRAGYILSKSRQM